MQRSVIVRLIEDAVQAGDSAWADFGSGDGAFTRVLRDLLDANAHIYSVEIDGARLRRQRKLFQSARGAGESGAQTRMHFIEADFTHPLDLPPLDGILLANALHFVSEREQVAFLHRLRETLKPPPVGRLLIVEYDVVRASMWVPHPVASDRLESLAADAGYAAPTLLAAAPSQYSSSQIYSALLEPLPEPA